ncbi:hypothetical protein GYMLUDRAFT_266014 [Collybiopsis luxurians FD-317 M1]|uniref:Peptidase A1 domain-containing protein n=1 Tax=Collybiopsis luxurians FD-317 M1 TaxID=944289 RepID=A0A0D0BNF6_9AGAR|nr:hypothetical protein GYMLUDRAFT_266014 [Collybiopsis luxurians FD-317 M1]
MVYSIAFPPKAFLSFVLACIAVNGRPTIGNVRRVHSGLTSRSNTVLPVAQFSVAISGTAPRSKAKKELMKVLRSSSSSNFTSPVAGSDFDEEYLTNVTIGGQDFTLIVDTGSSDTWVAKQGFACFDLSGNPVPTSQCAFGTNGFDTSASPTYFPIPNTNFNISYGDGEFLTGDMAFDTVTVGGMTVPHQELGLVTNAAWLGDGIDTGLMGLASPNLTSAFEGTDPDADEWPKTQIPYNPLFYTAVQNGIVSEPYFSVALNRGSFEAENSSLYDPDLGYIAFGGIAPVPVTSTVVTVPIQGYDASTFLPSNGTRVTYFYYTVDVESMSFTGNTQVFGTTNDIILDTGTTLNYVPTDVADAFAAAFDPPATWDDDFGLYVFSCGNSTVPEFTVNIAGTTFVVDPEDNVLPLGVNDDDGNEVCASGTTDGGPNENGNIFILGDTFLHNVVTTFNIHTDEVTITQREVYSSGISTTSSRRRRRTTGRNL